VKYLTREIITPIIPKSISMHDVHFSLFDVTLTLASALSSLATLAISSAVTGAGSTGGAAIKGGGARTDGGIVGYYTVDFMIGDGALTCGGIRSFSDEIEVLILYKP